MPDSIEALNVRVSADASSLRRGMRDAGRDVERFGSRSTAAFRAARTAALAMGAAVAAGLASAAKAAASYETSLAQFAAKTGRAVGDLDALYTSHVDAIAVATGKSADAIVDGFQKAESAGLKGAAAIALVSEAAQFSAAGLGQLDTAVSAATSVLAAYGPEALSVAEALGAVTVSAQIGEGETEHFSQALKQVVPTASALKVPLGTLAGALSAISQVAPSVSEGATQLRAVFTALLNPSKQAEEIFAGVGTTAERLRAQLGSGAGGLSTVLETLRGLDQGLLSQALGSSEALSFVLSVDPASVDAMGKTVRDRMATATGDAFAEGADTLGRRLGQIGQAWQAAQRNAGGAVVAALDAAIDRLGGLAGLEQIFAGVARALTRVVEVGVAAARFAYEYRDAILAVGATIGAVLALNAAIGAASGLWTAASKIGKAATAALSKEALKAAASYGWVALKVAAVVAAVAAVAYVASVIYRAWDPIGAYFSALWDRIKAGAGAIPAAFEFWFGNAADSVRDLMEGALRAVSESVNNFIGRINGLLEKFGADPIEFRLDWGGVTPEEAERRLAVVNERLAKAGEAVGDLRSSQAALEDAAAALGENLGAIVSADVNAALALLDEAPGRLAGLLRSAGPDLGASGASAVAPSPSLPTYADPGAITSDRFAGKGDPAAAAASSLSASMAEAFSEQSAGTAQSIVQSLSGGLRSAFKSGDFSDLGANLLDRVKSTAIDSFFDSFDSALGSFFDSAKDSTESGFGGLSGLFGKLFGKLGGGGAGAGGGGIAGFFGSLLSFDGGGSVPGAPGQPVPILAHGGETVFTPEQLRGGMGGNVTIETAVYGSYDERLEEALARRNADIADGVEAQLERRGRLR